MYDVLTEEAEMSKNSLHESPKEFAPDAISLAVDAPAGGNVDKIRDILFGAQIRTYESRFARMEETLTRETTELKETTKKRFDSLEAFFRRETESLAARWKEERDDRSEQLRALSAQLKENFETLLRKTASLEDRGAKTETGLRSELMEESNKLLDEIRARHADLSALLEKRVQELRHDKTDRSSMAALLTEMAIRLSEDAQAPAGE